MTKPTQKLNQINIDRDRIDPQGKPDFIKWDDELPGFGLRIREGGSRTYVIQYKIGTKNRRKTLGSVKKLTLKQARDQARKDLGRVANGKDPQAEKARARARAAETFKALADRFLDYQAPRLRPSSYSNTKLYLLKHCKPLHALQAEAVTRRDIASILHHIAKNSGAVSADRARAALRKMFAWAMSEGLVEANPVIGTNTYAGNTDRDRVLSDQEVVAIWSALPDNDYGKIVKLLFLTGARRDEIGSLRWSEISEDVDLIKLPAERTKNKRPFDLPIGESARLLVLSKADEPSASERDYVFGRRDTGFKGWSKAKAELKSVLGSSFEPWRLHDVRRTVTTRMAEDLDIQPHIIEAALNHVSGAKAGVAGVYNRAVYAKEKREAFEGWENHLKVILAKAWGANVHTLRRA